MKNVLVLGASLKQDRYSNMAMKKLASNHFKVMGLGYKEGEVSGMKIQTEAFRIPDVYAVTIYLNPYNQKGFYEYVLGLKPDKVIFNPGAENREFESFLEAQGIYTERACTLVLLSMNAF
mgnify:CR=1 FL=1